MEFAYLGAAIGAGLGNAFLQGILPPARQGDGITFRQKGHGGTAANAGTRPCHDRNLAVTIHCIALSVQKVLAAK